MADIEAVNGVAAGSIEAINGVAKGSIEEIGGLGVPAGGVTASDVLVHWWKMNDGATTAADFGTATGTGTAVTHVGAVSSTGGGPSAIGSPDCILYDGVNDNSWVKIRDYSTGTETTVGTNTTSDETFTMTFWMKDLVSTTGYGTWVGAVSGWFWNDGFVFWNYQGSALLSADVHNVKTAPITLGDVTDSTWHHYIMEFDNPSPSGGTSGPSALFSITQDNTTTYSHAAGSYYHTELDGASQGNPVHLSFGSWSNGIASSYHMNCMFSDIRVYSRVLTSGEKTAIYAGDW
jgi:hypothetical protein